MAGGGVGGSELQAAKLGLWTPYAQSHQKHLYLITALLCVPEGKKKYKRDKRARLGSGAGNVKVNTQTQSLTPPPVGVRLSALQQARPQPPLF